MKKITYILVSIFLIVTASCTKKEEYGNSISLTGYVALYDKDGHSMEDEGGVTVTIQNSDKSNQTLYDGSFIFNDLKALTNYTLIFSKENFDEATLTTDKYIGDAKPAQVGYSVYLYELPSVTITNVTVESSNNSVMIKGVLTETNINHFCSVYISDQADVSINNYDYSEYMSTNSLCWFNLALRPNSYADGTKLYVALYIHNPAAYPFYPPEREGFFIRGGKKAGVFQVVKK
jgi:hypothetical protein